VAVKVHSFPAVVSRDKERDLVDATAGAKTNLPVLLVFVGADGALRPAVWLRDSECSIAEADATGSPPPPPVIVPFACHDISHRLWLDCDCLEAVLSPGFSGCLSMGILL
jgi:hypothetical protein